MVFNIGGYDPSSMQAKEKHEIVLVLTSNSLEAKSMTKSKQLISGRKKHKDDIVSLNILISYEDCKLIKKIGCKEIEFSYGNDLFKETNFLDWLGYKKIDKIKKIYTLFLYIKFISILFIKKRLQRT